MKLFAQVVRTGVHAVLLPIELAKDCLTLCGATTKGRFEPYTVERLEKMAEDAQED